MNIYVVYHMPSKSYVGCSGYYGNSTNIAGYSSKDKAKLEYPSREYKIKKMRIKS